ncbi:zinc finger protein 678-like [Neocloeon triangulifer]|uniref:zinc finger protein 678-like n=1 Tax=Neocloeon triangulifer TaxID=2078957 RepID=UPI00286F369C|nr:zinc finger protein 678-like [Neocloeon triangulifer]XP_059478143.1 zinc finger protein 678-like [Neocloeon triangulifer]
MTQDLQTMCRTCAGSSTNLLPIFGHDGVEKKLQDKINSHLPILVMENDLLPTKICSRCIFSLEASIEFKNICNKADETLKNILGEQQPHWNEITDEIVDHGKGDNMSIEWVKSEDKQEVVFCESCNIFFANMNSLLIHNQTSHQPQATLIIPTLDPMESVFYNEVEITKKTKKRQLLPKISLPLMQPAKTSELTVINPPPPKKPKSVLPPIIKLSPTQSKRIQEAPAQIPVKSTSKILSGKRLNIPSTPINSADGGDPSLGLSELENKSLIIPPLFGGRKEDALDVAVFVPETQPFELGNPLEESLPIHVNIPAEYSFHCDNCNRGFKNKALLRDHIIRKYILTDAAEFSHECEECGKKFPTTYSLKAHLRNKRARTIKIQCDICLVQVTKKDWSNHFAVHNNHERFKCLICQQTFGSSSQLNQHSSVHSNMKFTCDICDTVFNRKSNLLSHRKIHTEALTDQLKCDICNYQSNDRYYMMHHHKVHFSTDLNAYFCPVSDCSFKCGDFQDLLVHSTSHTRAELNLYTKRKKRGQRVSKTQIPPYLCSVCKTNFTRPLEYSSHVSQEHGVELMAGEAIFTCNHCLECYSSLLDLNEHLERHPEAHKYPCSKCPMTFAVFNNRNQHLASVHSTKFECEICQMSFMTVFKLKEHMPAHSNIKPFICTTCGKGFKRKRTLGEHQKVHSGVKRFICEHCNSRFRWKGDLVRHATRHTGINLYHCSECEFSSNKRKEVEAHIGENHSVIVDMQA